MSIAEKLQTIAENERKVFEAGKRINSKDIVMTSSVSTVFELYNMLFANIPNNHFAVAFLTQPKELSECINNQILSVAYDSRGSVVTRYRDGNVSSANISKDFDAAVTIGDIYRVYDLGEI